MTLVLASTAHQPSLDQSLSSSFQVLFSHAAAFRALLFHVPFSRAHTLDASLSHIPWYHEVVEHTLISFEFCLNCRSYGKILAEFLFQLI